ncbi:MAG: ribosome small subunit-dependent GTPase A [Mycoplasmatales bacterium]
MQIKGLVIKAIASFFYVEVDDVIYECRASTKLKRNKKQIITGEYVMFDAYDKYIIAVLPRDNELIRPKIANVSNAVLVFSAIEPKMNFGLLDRMLLIMEINKLDSTIVITKMDLLDLNDQDKIKKSLVYYEKIGYRVLYTLTTEDIKSINDLIKKDKYVFTGQTGVGKSTLINKLLPELNIKTQPISKALGRGKHTTREVTFYHHKNSYIIDTPGFSALDLPLTTEIVRDNYIDFYELSDECRFKGCYHLKEPSCNVKNEIAKNDSFDRRYENYVKIMEEINKEIRWIK